MVMEFPPPSFTPRSHGTGRSMRKHLDPWDDETSNRLDMPKRCLTEEEIQRVVREELKPVKSDLKKVRKGQKLFKSHLADLLGSCIRDTVKEGVVPAICSSLENTSRRVVREELKHARSQSAQLVRYFQEKDDGRNLQLQFRTRLSLSVFTGQKLEGEQGVPIEVVLVNANTGNIVKTGPESSVKLEVVVLEGGFKTEDDVNWTREEFEKYIVKEHEGKRPLLTGNLEVILERGTGVLGEVEFTDNSSWTQSKKFRIGLQVSPRYSENICIREATTESFTVEEHRGEHIEDDGIDWSTWDD